MACLLLVEHRRSMHFVRRNGAHIQFVGVTGLPCFEVQTQCVLQPVRVHFMLKGNHRCYLWTVTLAVDA